MNKYQKSRRRSKTVDVQQSPWLRVFEWSEIPTEVSFKEDSVGYSYFCTENYHSVEECEIINVNAVT